MKHRHTERHKVSRIGWLRAAVLVRRQTPFRRNLLRARHDVTPRNGTRKRDTPSYLKVGGIMQSTAQANREKLAMTAFMLTFRLVPDIMEVV